MLDEAELVKLPEDLVNPVIAGLRATTEGQAVDGSAGQGGRRLDEGVGRVLACHMWTRPLAGRQVIS